MKIDVANYRRALTGLDVTRVLQIHAHPECNAPIDYILGSFVLRPIYSLMFKFMRLPNERSYSKNHSILVKSRVSGLMYNLWLFQCCTSDQN